MPFCLVKEDQNIINSNGSGWMKVDLGQFSTTGTHRISASPGPLHSELLGCQLHIPDEAPVTHLVVPLWVVSGFSLSTLSSSALHPGEGHCSAGCSPVSPVTASKCLVIVSDIEERNAQIGFTESLNSETEWIHR